MLPRPCFTFEPIQTAATAAPGCHVGISTKPGILFCTRSDRKLLPFARPLPFSPTDAAVWLGRACALSVLFFVEGKCGMARVSTLGGGSAGHQIPHFQSMRPHNPLAKHYLASVQGDERPLSALSWEIEGGSGGPRDWVWVPELHLP